MRFPSLADFRVSQDGSAVRCWPVDGVSAGTIEHLYLNQVLPLALSKQRRLVFHASTVEVEGGAAAFLGESGSGKSTLAASFGMGGHRVLTDDGLLVEEREGVFEAQPSHPSIRLWEDSQAALMDRTAVLAPAVQYTSKVRILAHEPIDFCREARRLRRIFFLVNEGADGPAISPVKAGEALAQLVRHSFLLDIEEREMLAYHFDRLAAMVREPICWRLDYPRRYDALPAVRRAILENAAE